MYVCELNNGRPYLRFVFISGLIGVALTFAIYKKFVDTQIHFPF